MTPRTVIRRHEDAMPKVANRHMLYAEMLAGWFAASTGVALWYSKGMLKTMLLSMTGSSVYTGLLGAPLIVAGALLIAVCAVELFVGRKWDDEPLRLWSTARQWLNITLCLGHFALLVALIQMSSMWFTPGLTLNCFALIALCGLAAYKARRLCFALDPNTRTERLIQEIPRSL